MLVPSVIGAASFLLVSLILGPGILIRGIRTRAQSEILLGLGVICAGVLASVLQVLAHQLHPNAPGLASLTLAVALFFGTVGIIAVCFFTWRLFRPNDPWARAICLGLSAILMAAWAAEGLVRGFNADGIDGWLGVVMGLRGLGFAWAGFESTRYWLQLRRRQRLGIADPLLVNRFLLTGVACIGICLALGVPAAAQAVGVDSLRSYPMAWLFMLFSITASASLWLGWAPPRAYCRLIELRAARAR